MSKGSKRRPQKVADKQLQANWDRIFKPAKSLSQKWEELKTSKELDRLHNIAIDVMTDHITVTGKRKKKEGKK